MGDKSRRTLGSTQGLCILPIIKVTTEPPSLEQVHNYCSSLATLAFLLVPCMPVDPGGTAKLMNQKKDICPSWSEQVVPPVLATHPPEESLSFRGTLRVETRLEQQALQPFQGHSSLL